MKLNELQAEKKKIKPYEYKKAKKPLLKPKSEQKPKQEVEIAKHRAPSIFKESGFIPPRVEKFTIKVKRTKIPIFTKPKDESVKDVKVDAIVSELIARKNVEKYLKDGIEMFLEPQKLAILLNAVDKIGEIRLKTNFDSSFTSVKPSRGLIHVPTIDVTTLPKISIKTDFDKSLPEISPVERVLYVPKLSIEGPPELTIRSEFDAAVHIDLSTRDKHAEYTVEGPTNEVIEMNIEEIMAEQEYTETSAAAESTSEDLEDLFDFVIKPSYGRFSEISPDRPIVLLLPKFEDDNYSATLQIICREIFHEIVGGLPEARRLSKEEKDKFDDLYAEGRIEFIDESATKYFESDLNKFKSAREWPNYLDWNKIRNRLNEMYSQGFGFVIFHVPENLIGDFEKKIKEVSEDLKPQIIKVMPKIVGNYVFKNFSPNIRLGVEIDSKKAKYIKRKISSAIWGFVTPKGDERWESGETFDNFFGACERAFHEKLRKIGESDIRINEGSKEKRIPVDILVNSAESESRQHYYMKVFVVKYLIEKLGYNKDEVKTEEEAKIDEKTIPDVRVRDVAIEIETLYGTGRPLGKIADTIKKYKNKNIELWLIVKNLDAIMYYRDLKKRAKAAKEELGVDVKFFTLNIERLELVPLEALKQFIERLNRIFSV